MSVKRLVADMRAVQRCVSLKQQRWDRSCRGFRGTLSRGLHSVLDDLWPQQAEAGSQQPDLCAVSAQTPVDQMGFQRNAGKRQNRQKTAVIKVCRTDNSHVLGNNLQSCIQRREQSFVNFVGFTSWTDRPLSQTPWTLTPHLPVILIPVWSLMPCEHRHLQLRLLLIIMMKLSAEPINKLQQCFCVMWPRLRCWWYRVVTWWEPLHSCDKLWCCGWFSLSHMLRLKVKRVSSVCVVRREPPPKTSPLSF